MATGSDNLEVIIEGERHSPLSVPEASSALVRTQRDSFSGKLDIEQFVEYIRHVGHFIKIVYNGVNAAGPRFTDLQIEVQKLGYDITELYNHSYVTIDRFQATASTVSSRLESMYQFLLDGSDDAAVTTVTSLNELAKEMVIIACELKEKFEKQEKKVEGILKTAMKTKSAESKCNWEQLEKDQKEMEQMMQSQKESADRYNQLVREAEDERMEYETKEREIEERNDDLGIFGIIANAMLLPFANEAMDDALHKEMELAKKAKGLKKIDKKKIELELQQQNLYHEALQKMRDFASKLKNAKSEDEMADIVIEALHKTSGALRHLSLIMTEASRFWTYIQDRCNSLSDKNFKELMGVLNSKGEETKKKFWRGKVFTKESETYNSRWQALRSACEEYKKSIDATRADLLEYIKDNPTYDESLQRLPQLTRDFLKILDKAKNETEQKKRQ